MMLTPKSPPRLEHIYSTYSTPLYFVTVCTEARQPILANINVHRSFIDAANITQTHGATVGRYVIMPDHIHLFIRIGLTAKLEASITCLKRNITKCIHALTPNLTVWQTGFFDHLVRNSDSYSEKWNYVCQNPVRANLVRNPNEWPYQGELQIIDRA